MKSPQPSRAVAGLLINLIVMPGLGTLVSGDLKRRKIGWVQLGLAIILVPALALVTTTTRTVLANSMMVLAFWSVLTSALTLWDAYQGDRMSSAANPT